MKTIIIIAFVLALFNACSKEAIRGSGNTITETRTVDAFTGVRLEGSGKVNIIQGTTQNVQVTGYENLVPIYQTFVQNKTLVLKFRSDYYNVSNNNITVNIKLPALTKVAINGSGEYSIKNFTGANLAGEINGSGEIYFENCKYDKAVLKVNGSGSISAAQVEADEADAEINGSGKIDVRCLQSLKATIHGSGEINYWGSPANVTVQVSGSGRVVKK